MTYFLCIHLLSKFFLSKTLIRATKIESAALNDERVPLSRLWSLSPLSLLFSQLNEISKCETEKIVTSMGIVVTFIRKSV